ncbi:MAG: trypco2 family protein [Cyanobacteria bacterium P01_A01_bin.80]
MSKDNSIGLSELIEKVKADLLASPDKNNEVPFLFVESVEMELQVTVKKEGKGGLKVDVVSIGGAELGGGVSQDKVQKIKVKLSPLFDKDEIKDFYKKLRPNDRLSLVQQSLKGVLKGDDNQVSADDTVE